MRKHATWLTQADERILEFLHEYGNHPPSAICSRLAEIGGGLEYSSNHVGMRCRALANHGLLINVGGGTYSITDLGESFLEGELDADELEPNEE